MPPSPATRILAAPNELRIKILIATLIRNTQRILGLLLHDRLIFSGRYILPFRFLVRQRLDGLPCTHGFACLARTGHPNIGRRLSRTEFLALGHAVVRAEGRSQEVFEGYLLRQRIERRVILNVPHYMSIPLVIAKSDLIVTVPLAVGTSFASVARLRLLRPPFDIPWFDIKQHWHRRVHKDARSRWLRTQIASLFKDAENEWGEPQWT